MTPVTGCDKDQAAAIRPKRKLGPTGQARCVQAAALLARLCPEEFPNGWVGMPEVLVLTRIIARFEFAEDDIAVNAAEELVQSPMLFILHSHRGINH